MSSALYEGWVRHRRFGDVEHEFRYKLALHLDELPVDGLLGEDEVRDLIQAQMGTRPTGDVRVLHARRSLGVGFNPVRFYYAWHQDAMHAVVAEVTNTPWGERHSYVLDPAGGRVAKELHVSPLQPMDQEYAWRVTEPGEQVVVHFENHEDGERVFDATMRLLRARGRAPWAQPLRILGRIYRQSLRLKLKGAPYHPHPRTVR